MKKGILTFQNANNYGAVFQAFALRNVLDRLDRDGTTNVVNYISKEMGLEKKLETGFREFIEGNLGLTRRITEIDEIKDEFELLIVGSDQVFNPRLTMGDSSYFLPLRGRFKKASYAASLGIDLLKLKEYSETFARYLSDFEEVSIREAYHKSFLEEMGIKTRVDLDPTLLLDREEWIDSLDLSSNLGEYILLFSYQTAPKLVDTANMISIKYGIPIISIALGCTENYLIDGSLGLRSVDPITWISLVSNAKLVLTESYHGMLLSIALSIPFLVYTPRVDSVVRIIEILDKFGLRDRTIRDFDISNEKIFTTDYTYTRQVIEKERKKAFEYLGRLIN